MTGIDFRYLDNKIDSINQCQLITSQTYAVSNSSPRGILSLPKAENQYNFVLYIATISNTSASRGSINIGDAIVIRESAGNTQGFAYTHILNNQYCIYTSEGNISKHLNIRAPYSTAQIQWTSSIIYYGNLRIDVYAY